MILRNTLAMALLATSAARAEPQAVVPEIIQRIRSELQGPLTEDSKMHPGVPHGEFIEGVISNPRAYPGTENGFRVYVPAQYDPSHPACLLLRLDGLGENEPTVIDNLIARGDMPVTIAVGLSSGSVRNEKGGTAYRWNRSYEFDSTNGVFPGFVIDELLPRVEGLKTKDGRPLHLSHDAKDRAVMGASTGGIGSFTLAWQRPDSFSRVYSMIGTFVAMRGGNDYPALIRKTEPKAIRVFLEDGATDAWNPLFGTWFMANENIEAALSFAGYDVQHAWGVHGHDGGPGNVILPDVLRWLWQGWPAPVEAGHSANDMLAAILEPGDGWKRIPAVPGALAGLASSPQGEVYWSDAGSHALYRLGTGGKPEVFSRGTPEIRGEAFARDGTLYATAPATRQILAFDAQGEAHPVGEDIGGNRILVTPAGELLVTEPGLHSDEPSTIWRIHPDGKKDPLDRGLLAASGIAFSPDGTLLFAAESAGNRVYSFVAADGPLLDREPFYWLHAADMPLESGTQDIAVDLQGNLYAATRIGIQVCDRNGRVRALLPLPSPCGPVQGICWGGTAFDTLYATDGAALYSRRMRVPGYPQWSAPVVLPKSNAG